MRKLLEKFVSIISESEKKFELNILRVKELNKMLFEYENLSIETYQDLNSDTST